MEEEYKKGDRVLVKRFGSIFHVHILGIKTNWLGTRYLCEWRVHDVDSGGHWTEIKFLRKRNFICKD